MSGGHTMIIWAKELGQYSIMGSTLDESVGEAIDKAACIIGFNYDSEYGPAASLVKAASGVIKSRFTLPSFSVSSKIQHGLDFSFSGLRTALSNLCKSEPHFHEQNIKNELASSFIKSCTDQLSLKLLKCINLLSKSGENINTVVISGGVACNDLVYNDLRAKLSNENINLIRPGHKQHCTDNAMMIAWTAIEYIKTNTHTLNYLDVDPEWSLTNMKLDLHKSYRISNENPNVML